MTDNQLPEYLKLPLAKLMGILEAKGVVFIRFLPEALDLEPPGCEELLNEARRRYSADIGYDRANGVLYLLKPRLQQPIHAPKFDVTQPFSLTFEFLMPARNESRRYDDDETFEAPAPSQLYLWRCPRCSFSDSFPLGQSVTLAVRIAWSHMSGHTADEEERQD